MGLQEEILPVNARKLRPRFLSCMIRTNTQISLKYNTYIGSYFMMQVTVSCRRETEFCMRENLTKKPRIKFIRDNEVFFEDDTSIDVDVIVSCTG